MLTTALRCGSVAAVTTGGTRRPVRLDREGILDAAFAVAEDAGHRGLTMRRVGAELGADPTAVYRHFRNKDELITAMADRLFGEVIDNYPEGRWRDGLRNGMLMGRRVYRTHPGFAEALAATPDDTPNLERLAERVLGRLRQAGLTDADVVLFYHLIVNYVAGTGVFEAVADEAGEESWQDRTRRAYAALPPERFPNCVALAPHMYPDPDLVFEAGAELLLDAVEARAGRAQEGRQ
jgi:AcrR family transcriptional regulator